MDALEIQFNGTKQLEKLNDTMTNCVTDQLNPWIFRDCVQVQAMEFEQNDGNIQKSLVGNFVITL